MRDVFLRRVKCGFGPVRYFGMIVRKQAGGGNRLDHPFLFARRSACARGSDFCQHPARPSGMPPSCLFSPMQYREPPSKSRLV
uniref:Uncharacterized protein n=1 Tax=Myoviridae sp. ctu2j3 TaxID=2825197 RepID=A0A8S5UI84_9CAUD|nr:MAG TPA: hypothetical protein [Myoviridae sp. ctu2j3]DAF94271.1 MAG TPA: hypothetical protein [Myoviridae sp. ctu2j3]